MTPEPTRVTDLTAFERDLLYVVRALERDGAPKGLAIKRTLEADYGEEIHHSRLYQNLDGLEDRGLIEKQERDGRTNEYATTDTARELLAARVNQRAVQVGLALADASGSDDTRGRACWPDTDPSTPVTPDPDDVTAVLDGAPMNPVDVSDGSGTWRGDTEDDTTLRVTLRWNDVVFTHASARVDPDGRDAFVALERQSPCTPPTTPVFSPVLDTHAFEIELRPGEHDDSDSP